MSKSDTINAQGGQKLGITEWLWDMGIITLLGLATIVINYKMIKDGLNGMPDIRWHITWLQHFSQELAEGIWYPRWLAGTNFGYGSPTFVFYPPLPYYLGSILKFLGLDTHQALVSVFSLSLFGCGFNFYIYGRRKWGKFATLVGSLVFMSAPFLGYNIYFAARFAEVFALLWVPLGLWLTDKALQYPRWRIPLAVFFACFALSHVPSLLLGFIFWLPYTFFALFKKPWQAVVTTIGAAFAGFGMVSLYLLPALKEKSLVNTEAMKSVLGGFRANVLGTPLTLNKVFLVRIQSMIWVELAIIAVLLMICFWFHRRSQDKLRETWSWLAFAGAIALMMSKVALPLWQASPTLQMVQFPWRMMGLFSFALAGVASLAVNGILKHHLIIKILFSCLFLGILFWNFQYTYKLSRGIPTINNPGKGKVANLEHITIALNEPYEDKLIDVRPYRPLINQGYAAPDPIIDQPPVVVIDGEAEIKMEHWDSYHRQFQVKVEKPAKIRMRTYYYPAWHLYVDNKPFPISIPANGTMEFELKDYGSHTVKLDYGWTDAFKLGIILSLGSVVAVVTFALNYPWLQRLSLID